MSQLNPIIASLSGPLVDLRPEDSGLTQALGVGTGAKRLNTNCRDVQDEIDVAVSEYLEVTSTFVNGARYDYYRNGLPAEVVAGTPVLVYDLPELYELCDTAFVDGSGKIYIAGNFARCLLAEHKRNQKSLHFILGHEASHLIRLHGSRAHFEDLDPALRMRALDARINIDLVKMEAAERLTANGASGIRLGDHELDRMVRQVLAEFGQTSVRVGVAMNFEDYKRWERMSEEAIAIDMLKSTPSPDPIPNREVSFPLIMEGAAQEVDAVKVMLTTGVWLPENAPEAEFTPNELSALSTGLRHIGKHKAENSRVSEGDIQSAQDALMRFRLHQGLIQLDLNHERSLQMSATGVHASGKTGDSYLDVIKPSERVRCALDVLRSLLQAKAGSQEADNAAPSIKDLERSLGRGESDSQPGNGQQQQATGPKGTSRDNEGRPAAGSQGSSDTPGTEGAGSPAGQREEQSQVGEGAGAGLERSTSAGAASGRSELQPGAGANGEVQQGPAFAGDFVPFPSGLGADTHVIPTEKLVKTLQDAGVSAETLKKLGYGDIIATAGEVQAAASQVISAINKASLHSKTLGARYAGGHMVGYAQQQLQMKSRPMLTWQMAYRKMVEESGRGTRVDETEPWVVYNIDHRDMGLASAHDVPYLGSVVPGKAEPALILNIYDVSGSVSENMIERFLTEGINQCRTRGHGRSIDSVHVSADTIARGDPVYVTEKNYRKVLSEGFTVKGRGGTNLQAAIEHAFHLVKPGGKRTPYSGRKIDALAYWTDLGDEVPDPVRLLKVAQQCGMKKLPTMLFLAPRSCFSDKFNRGTSTWATVVYFDDKLTAKQTIKLDDLATQQELQAPGWSHRVARM